MAERDYIYYDYTKSLCPECLHLVDTKIVFKDEKVWMHKHCKEHGNSKTIIADDIEYYKNIRNYNKASEMPVHFGTPVKFGCPYDCGLCTDHEQHSCLSLVELTDRCNLTCPTCYASSSPTHGRHRSFEEIEKMFDTIVRNEGTADVVQISGGEPTVHPKFWEIMDMAKTKNIRHIMLNTNGVKIAKDKRFAERLASYMPDFEVYLQFDSLNPKILKTIRGEDLSEIRLKAIEHLNEYNLSTTLVVTLQKGLNDHEIGDTIRYALSQKAVRGITFQPTQVAGRNLDFNAAKQKITLTEVRRKIYEQTDIFTPEDIIPVPCNPDNLAMAYALKYNQEVFALTRWVNPQDLLNNSKNTIVYEQDERLQKYLYDMFSTGISVEKAETKLAELMCCLPLIPQGNLDYSNLFRIIIMNFMDAYDFDVRAVKKSCVHIIDDNMKLIPFETMNLFYRDGKVKEFQK